MKYQYKEMPESMKGTYGEFAKNFGFICDTIDMWCYAVPLGLLAAFVFKLPVKKATGKGLLDYIHALRIEYAKELIKNTDNSLKIIAEKVGYSNNLTLIRAFKRYEGITPSAYKEM